MLSNTLSKQEIGRLLIWAEAEEKRMLHLLAVLPGSIPEYEQLLGRVDQMKAVATELRMFLVEPATHTED